MVFPTSNLSTAAQPWGRFVEKSITTLETTTATERVNNAARDAQAALNIKRLDASLSQVALATIQAQSAADKAQQAIDALGALDETTSTYKINAANVTVGTLTGITLVGNTIKTAASGTRVELAGTRADFYYGSTNVGYISGGTGGASDNAIVISANVASRLFSVGPSWMGFYGNISNFLGINGNQVQLGGSNGISVTGAISGALSISVSGTLSGSSVSVTGGISAGGAISTSSGNITSTGLVIASGGSGNVRAEAQAGSTTVAANINTLGTIVRSTSSIRYKQDVLPLVIDTNKLLALQPKTFRLKSEVELLGDDAVRYPGLIAEDLHDAGLEEFVVYEYGPDGNLRPDNIRYSELSAALIVAIQDLSARIAVLENK